MKNNLIKTISFILCLCILSSFCFGSVSNAAGMEPDGDNNVKVICNDENVCIVEGSYNNTRVRYTLDKASNDITMQVIEKSARKLLGIFPGKDKITNYTVEIDFLSQSDSVSAIATNVETGESFRIGYDSNKAVAQYAYPLIGILDKVLVDLLIKAGYVVVFGITTWFVLDYLTDELKKTGYEYFTADIATIEENNKMKKKVVVGHAIARSDASARIATKQSFLALRRKKAYDACMDAIKTDIKRFSLYGPEKHKDRDGSEVGYYYHYHITREFGEHDGHAFYLIDDM